MEERFNKVKNILKQVNQEQLLAHFDALDNKKQEKLLEEINQIDFTQMNNLYQNIGKQTSTESSSITPIQYVEKAKLEDKDKYFEIGAKKVKEGKLAIVTMAGGQGTRLRT